MVSHERKDDTDRGAMRFAILTAFNGDISAVAFDKLSCDEQPDPGSDRRMCGEGLLIERPTEPVKVSAG